MARDKGNGRWDIRARDLAEGMTFGELGEAQLHRIQGKTEAITTTRSP